MDGLEQYHDEGDVETDDLMPFVAAWWEAHESNPVGAEALIELTEADTPIPARKDDTVRARATRLGRLLGRVLDRVFEIQPDNRKSPIQVKLIRAELPRCGSRKISGFSLALLAGRKSTPNLWDVWEDEKNGEKVLENKENSPPISGRSANGNVWGQKPWILKENLPLPTRPIGHIPELAAAKVTEKKINPTRRPRTTRRTSYERREGGNRPSPGARPDPDHPRRRHQRWHPAGWSGTRGTPRSNTGLQGGRVGGFAVRRGFSQEGRGPLLRQLHHRGDLQGGAGGGGGVRRAHAVTPVCPKFPPCPKCGSTRYWISRGKVLCGSRTCYSAVRFILTKIEYRPVQ